MPEYTFESDLGAVLFFLVFQPYGVLLFDLWMGGVVASVSGLLIGIAWHIADAARRAQTHVSFLLFLGTLALVLLVLGGVIIDEDTIRDFPF